MYDEVGRAASARKGTPFLSTEQAAFYLGLSARTLQRLRGQGRGPRYRRHTRYVRYHIEDLDNWSKGVTSPESDRAC
jgi:excisionase family DNA binding protein